jgi:hypothetical protein
LGQCLLTARPEGAAVVIGEIGSNDPIAETGKAIELGRYDVAPIAGGDQNRWPGFVPGQRTDSMLGELHVVIRVGDRLATPELTPHLNMLFEIVAPPLVYATACLPLTLDLGQ